MTTVNDIIALAGELGIRARVWQKGGKLRIYAETQKHMNVYLELDGTPDWVEGAALKVFCNTEGQHPNWIKSQVAQARAENIALFYAYVVKKYSDTGPAPNGYGPDINSMIDEARAFVAANKEDA